MCLPPDTLFDGTTRAGDADDAGGRTGADGQPDALPDAADRDGGSVPDTENDDADGAADTAPDAGGPDDVGSDDARRDDAGPDEQPDVAADTGTCVCTAGPCCDGCHFRPESVVCGEQTERGCPDGEGCGARVGERRADRHCPGDGAGCDGELGAWSAWATVETCAADAECDGEAGDCRTTARCSCGATCDDDDRCTEDWCGGEGGCEHAALACDDGDPCTEDGCDPTSGCASEPATCDDADPCTVDTCVSDSGCQHTPAGDGTTCTYMTGSFIPQADVCYGGAL